jgi:endonuclease I
MKAKLKVILINLLIIIFAFSLYADYYDGTEGLTGDSLKSVLHEIIKGHTEYSYSTVKEILKDTDEDPTDTSNVILLYTGWLQPKDSFGNDPSDWNREHVWAKSHGNFGTAQGPGTDVHHIRPTDVSVNSRRGNLDFDIGGTEYIDGDGPTGCYVNDDSWEPRDEVKGDVARMIFYMAVRYEGDNDEPDLEVVDYIPSSPNNEPYHAKLSTLLEWHTEDSVDAWEQSRNEKIYEDWQHNRNPFIDHPEFADLIWGGVSVDEITFEEYGLTAYPNPFSSSTMISFSATRLLPINRNTPKQTEIKIYNVKGQLIKEFKRQKVKGKNIEVVWDGKDENNLPVGSGIYFYKLMIDEKEIASNKILLLR